MIMSKSKGTEDAEQADQERFLFLDATVAVRRPMTRSAIVEGSGTGVRETRKTPSTEPLNASQSEGVRSKAVWPVKPFVL